MKKINFIKYNSSTYKNEIKDLYNSSFPDDEKVPFDYLISLLEDGKLEFFSVENEEGLIGLDCNIIYKDIVYVFYLAVSPLKRKQGYGSSILHTIKNRYKDKRIILMIEEVDKKYSNYDERVKRLEFYKSNGLHELGYTHYEYGVVYSMLSMNEYVSREEYICLMCSVFSRYHFF